MSHVVDLESLGVVGDTPGNANSGARDCSPAWNAAIPSKIKDGDTILLPPNWCAFKSPINPLPSQCALLGAGGMSHMVRCFSQAPDDIFLTTGVTDCIVGGVKLWAADGTSGGVAVGRAATSPDDAPFETLLRRLRVTRFNTGNWHYGVKIDGRRGQPNYGARRIHFEDVLLSGITGDGSIGIFLGGVNEADGANVYVGGSAEQWGLWVCGVPGTQPCSQISFQGALGGTLLAYSTSSMQIDAGSLTAVTLDANCVGCQIKVGTLVNGPPAIIGKGCSVEAANWKMKWET